MLNAAEVSSWPPSDSSQAAITRLSAYNRRFLDFVEHNPECLDRSNFRALVLDRSLVPYPLQPWPTFVSRPLYEEAGRMSIALFELVKSLPLRLFGNDPQKLAAFYRLNPSFAALVSELLRDSAYLRGLLARGDFVYTDDGLKCLEINVGGNLGGWPTAIWAPLYARVPLFARFVREEGLAYHFRSPIQNFFRHLVENARATGLLEKQFGFGFLVTPARRAGPELQMMASQELRRALQQHAPGVSGEVMVCTAPELSLASGDRLVWRGRRLHALIEHTYERTADPIIRSLRAGQLNLYNGPATELFAEKRNLALLSEHGSSDLFDAAERELIARHVPWTRVVHSGTTRYQGETVRLPDLLLARREDLVLKPAFGSMGEGVYLGRQVSPQVWETAVKAALAGQNSWIVQAFEESLPFPYQHGEHGCAEHNVIWGLWILGPISGGAFLRMQKRGKLGVINSHQGATEGIVLEVDG